MIEGHGEALAEKNYRDAKIAAIAFHAPNDIDAQLRPVTAAEKMRPEGYRNDQWWLAGEDEN